MEPQTKLHFNHGVDCSRSVIHVCFSYYSLLLSDEGVDKESILSDSLLKVEGSILATGDNSKK